MVAHFQATTLVASPSYPNSIAWSEENLVAVASGHIVTILNPALLTGPRGLIKIPPCEPFQIGLIHRKDLLTGSLLPISLSRETRPCVRSISWSPLGFASNSGCLLSVCTTDGRVKLYRRPYYEFSAQWIEGRVVKFCVRKRGFVNWNLGFRSAQFDRKVERLGNMIQKVTSVRMGGNGNGLNEREVLVEANIVYSHAKWERNECVPLPPLAFHVEHRIDRQLFAICTDPRASINQLTCGGNKDVSDNGFAPPYEEVATARTEVIMLPCSMLKKGSSVEVLEKKSGKFSKIDLDQDYLPSDSDEKPRKRNWESETYPVITSTQYASRSALLSSLVVAWSPELRLSPENDPCHLNSSFSNSSVLAVGGKSGKVSFWRIRKPHCYSIEQSKVSVDILLLGLIQAHGSWVTTISWVDNSSDISKSRVILATGCSDGSVKIWLGDTERLLNSTGVNCAFFSLLKEVITVNPAAISVLSLTVTSESLDEILLAIGKGSGSLEVCICDISNCKFRTAGLYEVHGQVITGLAWAFNGRHLYSCSQDIMRSWILCGSSLNEVPFPSTALGIWNSTPIPTVFDSYFGFAISSGNLVLATVRNYNADNLNPMYEARTQKAAVEFFWIGGQKSDFSRDTEFDREDVPGFSRRDLVCWESNILWSLQQYQNIHKPLVIWDVIAALSAFQTFAPKYVKNILFKWLSSWFVGSSVEFFNENILMNVSEYLPKIISRQMHVLNIICRRVLRGVFYDEEDEQHSLWPGLLISSERELRERLVAFNVVAVLNQASCSTTTTPWLPTGVAQMEQWVAMNHDRVHDQLKHAASKVKAISARSSYLLLNHSPHYGSEYDLTEKCSFCNASVPFDSPEFAFCNSVKCGDGVTESHKLSRCAISMQVCPITTPLWYCVCCQRLASTLAPQSLFSISSSPFDLKTLSEFSSLQVPLCPFCGILLQRLQPEFLLSTLPV
ncbi:hypothetical protein GIB67_034558 [Kingdonia uniflora]|uniref:Transcription factor IIIC 90kDa subunit N-terminal domain-containing protein n=1 Tax=Kingdonia uniflora TaxID=39325 RepID=A0A7J7MXJ2_9MAGN|nr:hypothetical protein GIB67_034558 [Kingdonia uniflora]